MLATIFSNKSTVAIPMATDLSKVKPWKKCESIFLNRARVGDSVLIYRNGKVMCTSPVTEIKREKKYVAVETKNTVYYMNCV